MILKDLNNENDHFVRTPEDRSSKAMDRFKNVLPGVFPCWVGRPTVKSVLSPGSSEAFIIPLQ